MLSYQKTNVQYNKCVCLIQGNSLHVISFSDGTIFNERIFRVIVQYNTKIQENSNMQFETKIMINPIWSMYVQCMII